MQKWIRHGVQVMQRSSGAKKENVMFVGKDGKIIYVPNQATSIKVQKVWVDSKGQEVQKDSGDITVNIKRSIRKPVGYKVKLQFLYQDWDDKYYPFKHQIADDIYIEPGTSISYASQNGFWEKNWQDVLEKSQLMELLIRELAEKMEMQVNRRW